MEILLLTKSTPECKEVQDFLKTKNDVNLTIIEKDNTEIDGDIQVMNLWTGDYIISFLSPIIVPKRVLERARKCAINFHPAPPEYPGTGCYNFAIYEKAKEYGCTCHHMSEKVDSGGIIKVSRFPLYETDTVIALKDRTMGYILPLFYEIYKTIENGEELPNTKEKWTGTKHTRKELDLLGEIKPNCSEEELKHKIKATSFPGFKKTPYIKLHGHTFQHKK